MNKILNLLKSSSPRYNLVQPSTGKILEYRPFNVREEKSLLVAKNTSSYSDFLLTIADIIDNCFGHKIESKKLPIFDVEYLFLKLREKSVSEIVNIGFTCPNTKEKIKIVPVYLNEIEVKKQKNDFNIKVSDEIIVKMKYPTFEFLIENTISNESNNIDLFDMVLNSIESIQTPDEIITNESLNNEFLKEFIDSLTRQQYQLILDFFVKSPKIEHAVKYTTSDDQVRTIILRGIRDFFQ